MGIRESRKPRKSPDLRGSIDFKAQEYRFFNKLQLALYFAVNYYYGTRGAIAHSSPIKGTLENPFILF